MGQQHNFITTILLIAPILCIGCSTNNHEVSFKSDGMMQTFSEGQGAIPSDFPLPIYPNSTTDGSVSAESANSDEHSRFLMLSSKDSPSKVSQYYIEQLKSSGWKIDNLQTSANLINVTASLHDLEANVMLTQQNNKTAISLSVNKTINENKEPNAQTSNYQINKATPPTD